MIVYKKKSQILAILVLLIICTINTNFFRNFTEVFLYKFDDRIKKKYGHCSNESIGYLLYLKKEYEINDNPKIINYVHVPNGKWAIINTKIINKNSNSYVLLNYPGPEYKVGLKMINNNILKPNDIGFFSDKFDKIKSIEILNNSKDIKELNLKIDIVSVDRHENKKIIKKLNIENILDKRVEIKLDIFNKKLNLDENKLFFIIKNNNSAIIEDLKIKLILKNKFILENFKIINKISNCYYIK